MSDERVDVKFGAQIRDLLNGVREAHAATKDAVEGMKGHLEGLNKVVDTVQAHWKGVLTILAGGKLFKDAVEGTIEWTGSVVQLSKRLGITTESASGLNVALHHVGLTADDYNQVAQKMTRQMRTNESAFSSLGIATKEQNGQWRGSQEVMADAIEKLNGMQAGTDRNIAAQALFGARVGNITALLRLNKEMLEESRAKAEEYHLVVGPDGAAKVLAYKDAMADLKLIGESVKVQIGNALLPVLLSLGKWFGENGPVLTHVFTTAIQFVQYTLIEFGRDLQDLAFRWNGFVEEVKLGATHIASALLRFLRGDLVGAGAELANGWTDIRDQAQLTATAIEENARTTQKALEGIFAPPKVSKHAEGGQLDGDALAKDKKGTDTRLAEAERQWQLLRNVSDKGKDDLLQDEERYWLAQEKLVIGHSKEDLKLREQLHLKALAARRQLNVDLKAEARAEIATERETALDELDVARAAVEERRALRRLDAKEAAALLKANADEAYDLKVGALKDELALAGGDLVKQAEIRKQMAALDRAHNKELTGISKATTLQIAKDWEGVFSHLTNAIQTSFQGVMQGTQTLREAMRNVWRNVALDYASSKAQELKTHLAAELAKRGITTSSALHSVLMTSWSVLKNIASYAAQAAAAAWAAISAIPVVGPFLAPAVAGAAIVGVMALGSRVASAAGGYDIPSGTNPITQLHASEMVLPAELANVIRGMAKNGGAPGGGTVVHIHAMDAQSFREFARRSPEAFGDGVAAAIASNHSGLAKALRTRGG